MGGGVEADGSNMIYNLKILHQQSNYFTIYECKNVMRSLHPQMPRYLINGSYIELISFIFLPESSFI